MSRIVTKLLARVIKAEENEIVPFSMKEGQWGLLFATIEEVMVKCNALSPQPPSGADSTLVSDLDSFSGDHMAPCIEAVKTFVHHVLTAKSKQGKLMELRNILEKSGIVESSFTGKLFSECCKSIGISPIYGPSSRNFQQSPSKKTYDDDYLSELIFAVGGAEDDDDRIDAMDDLREYVNAHKDIDIQSHLSGVSAHFRKYILDQLNSPFRPLLSRSERSMFSGVDSVARLSSTKSVISEWSESNMSMSNKLRILKSKINAAEANANSLPQPEPSSPTKTTKKEFNTAPLSPEPSGQMSSLRQRLAEATVRANARSPEPVKGISRPSSATTNAAALRARLESVRRANNS